MQVAFIEGAILLLTYSVIFIKSSRKAKKKQKEAQAKQNAERITREGRDIPATVTRVSILRGKKIYTIEAQGYKPGSGISYTFKQTFPFPQGSSRSFTPNIRRGNVVKVRAVFHPLMYRMARSW
jgi:hypothetical protein